MLSQAQKSQLTALAARDYHDGYSMAGSIYKMVEERDGYEKAEEAVEFYCNQQKIMATLDDIEADAVAYQRSVEG